VDFGRPPGDEAFAVRATPLNGGQGEPHRVPVSQGQIVDGQLAFGVLLQARPTFRATRLAALVGTHLDLRPDFLDENLFHDTPVELV